MLSRDGNFNCVVSIFSMQNHTFQKSSLSLCVNGKVVPLTLSGVRGGLHDVCSLQKEGNINFVFIL